MQSYLKKVSKKRNILFLMFLLNIIFSTICSKNVNFQNIDTPANKIRNLQYALNSIYYNIVYPANDITGTGDRLKDVPYKVLCKIMSCNTGCCVGEIDNMRCGVQSDCKTYSDYSKIPGMVAAIVIPIAVFLILIAFFVFLTKFKKYSVGGAFCMCFGCLFVITIPVVIYYFCKNDTSVTPKNKERYINFSFLK